MKANDTTAEACIGKLLLIDNSIPLYQCRIKTQQPDDVTVVTSIVDKKNADGVAKKIGYNATLLRADSAIQARQHGEEKEITYAVKRNWDMKSLGLHRVKKEHESVRNTFAEQSKTGRWKGENQFSHRNRASLAKSERAIDLQKPFWADQELMEYNIQ